MVTRIGACQYALGKSLDCGCCFCDCTLAFVGVIKACSGVSESAGPGLNWKLRLNIGKRLDKTTLSLVNMRNFMVLNQTCITTPCDSPRQLSYTIAS